MILKYKNMKLSELYTILCTITYSEDGKKIPVFLEQWSRPTKKTDEQINAHFKKPNAGIGIATGKINGLTVIDFDSKDNELMAQLCELAPTYGVSTKKGFHLYYKYNDYFKQGTDRFKGGVDVRNDGGLVFAPPTKNYSPWVGNKINEITPLAIELMQRYEMPSVAKSLTTTETRNDTLFRKMCGWLANYPEQEAWNRSIKANREFIKGELTDQELEIMFQSAKKYQGKETKQKIEKTQ